MTGDKLGQWYEMIWTYNMKTENLTELTMYFNDTFNKLAFSSEVSVNLLNIDREKQYY